MCLSIRAFRRTLALNNDFSRGHLCQNPPALAGGRLSLAETAKANGIDFYKYLVKLLTELPNLPIHQQPEILNQYLPWSKEIQATCAK